MVLVKDVPGTYEKDAYRKANVSFKSASSCNISNINTLDHCSLSIMQREGRGLQNKRTLTEMNAAHELYLVTYEVHSTIMFQGLLAGEIVF